MAKKKAEVTTPEIPAMDAPAADTPAITQAEAVRKALKAGYESPSEGVRYIQEEFGIEVSAGYYSVIKSKEGDASKSKAVKIPSASGKVKIPAAKPASNGKPDVADSVAAVKKLVDELGAEQVVKLAGFFGK